MHYFNNFLRCFVGKTAFAVTTEIILGVGWWVGMWDHEELVLTPIENSSVARF